MRYKVYSIGELTTLKIHSIGYSSDTKETTFGPLKRQIYIVSYVLSGKGTYNNRTLHAGQGFLVTPDIEEHICPDENDPWELLWFSSTDPRFGDLFKYYGADEQTNVFEHDLFPRLDEIKEFVIANNRKTLTDGKMLEIFFSVFSNHQKNQSTLFPSKTAVEKYIDFSINYIRTHYNRKVTILQLTTLLGVSQPYLYRIFKETLGKSPKAFITEYRINQAKKLLSETDLSVAETAFSVGYSDSFSFSKIFSSIQGISPSEYRAIHKKHPHA